MILSLAMTTNIQVTEPIIVFFPASKIALIKQRELVKQAIPAARQTAEVVPVKPADLQSQAQTSLLYPRRKKVHRSSGQTMGL